jgi:hypothetical protein
MLKEKKTAEELSGLIMAQVAKVRACKGCTGVTVIRRVDKLGATNWTTSHTHNATPMCDVAIPRIVAGLQQRYDQKN